MSLNLTVSQLNTYCVPSPIAFDKKKQAQSIQTHGHEITPVRNKEKCEATSPYLQKGSRAPVIDYGEDKEVLKNKSKLTPEQLALYKTPKGLLKLNKPGIEVALDRRVALFFQQCILCYRMDAFTFVAGKAVDQIGVSKAIVLQSNDNHRVLLKREAAHSSTLPTLIAIPKDGSLPEGFVFLKGGSSHYQHNSTIGMSVAVNGADEVIDGKKPTEGLRADSIKIINKVAQGILDPVKATKKFIQIFKQNLTDLIEEREDGEDQRDVYEVLKYYKKVVTKIETALTDKEFFNKLIGVVINSEDPKAEKLQAVVYKKRYDIICLQEEIESRIAKKIDTAKATMGRNKNRLEECLLKQFNEAANTRTIFEKLFAKTAHVFDDDYTEKDSPSFKGFATSVDKLLLEHDKKIKNLCRSIRKDFRELSCAEFSYRSSLFKELRKNVYDWTQKEFTEKYQEVNHSAISTSWVSRMEQLSRLPYKEVYITPTEQRRSYITLDVAQKCARTFEIDPGLFLPSLFTSS